jgi:hypothetical protein
MTEYALAIDKPRFLFIGGISINSYMLAHGRYLDFRIWITDVEGGVSI